MKNIFIAAIVALVTAFITVKIVAPNAVATETKKESVYDRVMRTGTIRCGYALWPALIEKDPNTGKLSGIFPDYLEALGQITGLKIEWTAELGFGDFITALNAGRIDAMCSGAWTNAKRGMNAQFITPISYQGVVAWVRADDIRFDNNLAAINNSSIKIATIDGESGQAIAETLYPKAQTFSLPQLSETSQLMLNVAQGKADVTFVDHYTAAQFLKNNPDKIRAVPAAYPLKLFGNPIAIKMNEPALGALLNNATSELLNTGIIEQILQKHEDIPGTFYRAALSYIPVQ